MVRVRRVVVPVLLILLALPAIGAAAEKQTRPPRELHKVGDHWTAYTPPDPATFPANAKTYTIAKGDTLWSLAKQFYSNAYLWPQLWEANTYITDAHWIYPGDPLLVQGEASPGTVPSETAVTAAPAAEPAAAPEVTAQVAPAGNPLPLGGESDIYCFGYLGDPNEAFPNRIRGFEDALKIEPQGTRQEVGIATDDIIYIKGGTATGINPGDTYMVVMPLNMVYHPRTGALVGRHYSYRGQVKILCASDNEATAIVTQACNDIHIGDAIKPMVDTPIPLARMSPMANACSPPSGKASGYIVNSKDYREAISIGNVVEINLGKDDFVQPGDFLTVMRDDVPPGNPPQIVGELGILTAESHTATAMVVNMRFGMKVGDRVEVK